MGVSNLVRSQSKRPGIPRNGNADVDEFVTLPPPWC
jgi:hypothetical protein